MTQRRIHYCVDTLHRMWASGASYQEIAAALGCGDSFVVKLKRRHKLPNRQRSAKEVFENDPTPEQIESEKVKLREKHLAEMRAAPPGHASQTAGIRVYSFGNAAFRLVS